MTWAFSGKRKSEKLLQELAWFVDKLHALIPPTPQDLDIADSPSTVEIIQHLRSNSGVMRSPIIARKLEFRIRRTRKNRARRLANER
jgi:hypothetical protein